MEGFFFDLSVVLVGAAVLSCVAVLLKQPIIIAYIFCGILAGPWGFNLVKHVESIDVISHMGITLLLFLAGLCLHPQKLLGLFKKTSLIALVNCVFSFVIAFSFSVFFKFSIIDSTCIALALMFSSTILVIKLLPTTTLHQQRMGAICISILILQDLIAIGVLALINCMDTHQGIFINFFILLVKLSVLIGVLTLFENFILRRVMAYVDRMHEILFVLGLAWCLGVASVSNYMGLFYETGAFFAGVVLARHKIAFFISERLKPLRDFFLVLFFFALGAKLNLLMVKDIFLPAILLTVIFVFVKPWIFKWEFIWSGENKVFSEELGFRLGQLSEFSLLVAFLSFELGHISVKASQLIQLVTIFAFIMSSYLVVFKYPTPIGTSKKLIRD